MVRLKPSQGTIYNEPMSGVRPALGKTSKTRAQTLKEGFGYDKRKTKRRIKAEDIHQEQKEEALLKMKEISRKHSEILFKAKSVFPIDLFPDEIIITATKIIVRLNIFLGSFTSEIIPLQDIGDIEIEKGPFFAKLRIINIRARHPISIHYLRAKDAIKAKKLIDGLLIVQESGVDVSVIEPKELLSQLEDLGEERYEESSKT